MSRCLILLTLLAPLAALAEEPPREPPPETATEALLRVQSSGQQASTQPQVQTARERDQSMQRWLDTYKYVIPDFYRWTKINSSNN
ncbi:DUF3613 domain-containing protein [Pseudomonas entomophila]|uniref:DUF3613 domain-containing protein n=1 Tax=Pseudomonas entomophila TaxID=312306 RepID=UPI0023D84080|nr:DUF3613 domain-containing protein [Pseudomonas entomophila]MDF0733734.1 DUF3613 domain-containing protein [Pseudomonas entomophila]